MMKSGTGGLPTLRINQAFEKKLRAVLARKSLRPAEKLAVIERLINQAGVDQS